MGQLGDLSPAGSVAIGIFVGLVSTSVQSLGLTLQRKSHILEDEKEFQDIRRPPYKRRRWQLGMGMFIVSNLVGSTIQITTLPLPVLSTLQAAGLVFNSICATLILGEPFTRYSLAGTVLVCAGAILIATFGAIGEPAHTLDQLLELLGRKGFIIWMVATGVMVAAIIVGIKAVKLLYPYNTNTPRMRLWRGMAYGAISGILSAHSLLVAKSAVELLVRTIVDGVNQFNRLPSWMILLGLIAFALSQLYYLHRGLKLCSTSILYPFVFCVYNIIAILDGLIYFHQTSRLSLLSALLIALGTVILLTGVICLSWRLNNDPAAQPAIAQTALTPGMGLVPAEETDSATSSPTGPSDEESQLLLPRSRTFPTKFTQSDTMIPNYGAVKGKRNVRYVSSPLATPPANRSSASPSPRVRPFRRRQTIAEADEIWNELEEDNPSTPNLSPYARRRSLGTPSRLYRPSSSSTVPNALESSGELPPLDVMNASTPSLGRSTTGRLYRDRRKRRSTLARAGDGAGGRSSGRSKLQQGPTGGWWKMKKWLGSMRKGKEPDDGADNNGDEGSSAV